MQSFEGPYDAFVGFDVGKLAHRACCVLTGGAVAFNVGEILPYLSSRK